MKVKHTSVIGGMKNTCVQIAFKNACSWLDEQHIMDVGLVNKFYTPKGGTTTGTIPKYMDMLGILHEEIYDCFDLKFRKQKKPTIHRFMKSHPIGTFFVVVRGHALLIHNGKVFDPNFANYGIQRRILEVHRIVNADLEVTTPVWDQKTKFRLAIGRLGVAGLGFKKGSTNHALIRKMVYAEVKEPISFVEAKERYGMTMTSWVYFIERGIIQKESK